jgi:hypothetical protein
MPPPATTGDLQMPTCFHTNSNSACFSQLHYIHQQRKKGGGSKTTSTSTPAADTPAEPIAPPPRPTEQGRVLREWRSLGGRVIEADGAIPGSQGEDQPDFWEGEKFEGLGKAVERYFLPALLALGLLCGGIAAKTYDSGADVYIKSPTSPDSEASVLLAGPQ